VSRDWRAAASERSLWHSLHNIPTSVTDDQLLVLLQRGRSSADVKKLDLRGCTELTDEGLAAALTPLTGLTHLNVSSTHLSVAGVVAACAGKQLTLLSVAGLQVTLDDNGEEDAGLDALQLIGTLDVDTTCDMERDDGGLCHRLCSTDDKAVRLCFACEEISCAACVARGCMKLCGLHGCENACCDGCYDDHMLECSICHCGICGVCHEYSHGEDNFSCDKCFRIFCMRCRSSHFCGKCETLLCCDCAVGPLDTDKLRSCDQCFDIHCPACYTKDDGKLSLCFSCKKEFCHQCANGDFDIQSLTRDGEVRVFCKPCRLSALWRATETVS